MLTAMVVCGVPTARAGLLVGALALGAACNGESASTADGDGSSSGATEPTSAGPSPGPTTDDASVDGTADSTGPTPTPDLPLEPSPVTINEIMAVNDSTLHGPDGYSTPDWVELVNTGDEPVALSRFGLGRGTTELWLGSEADGEIAPGEHKLIWLDSPVGNQPGIWTGWSIDRELDGLALLFDERIVEEIAWTSMGDDVSYARLPDTTGELTFTAWPTPAATNGDSASPTLDSAQETVFLTDIVHRIDFVVSPETSAMLDQWERPEVHVEATIDGIRYPDIGLKLKGSASYDTMDGKPAFVVDMNAWVPDTRFRSLEAFKLHNGSVIDPTRARDHITYMLARDVGLMAPRVGWADVYVSDVYYGIYMMIERHDDVMIEARRPGGGELGMIFEPMIGWENDFGINNTAWDYEDGPDPMPPQAMASLDAVDAIISSPASDQNVAELWNHLDQESFYTYMAWETLIGHTDGYKAPNNWRIFVDGTTFKVEFAPSGAEWTWDFFADPWYFGGRAANWCNQNAGCRRGYAERILEVADRVEALDLLGEFVAQSEFLAPWIAMDPRYPIYEPGSYWYPYGTFDYAYPGTIERLMNNPTDARNAVYGAFPDLMP